MAPQKLKPGIVGRNYAVDGDVDCQIALLQSTFGRDDLVAFDLGGEETIGIGMVIESSQFDYFDMEIGHDDRLLNGGNGIGVIIVEFFPHGFSEPKITKNR